MRLYLYRHGAVASMSIFFGQFDNPLSEEGMAQTEAIVTAASQLELAAIYTSDLSRTAEAGRRLGRRIGLPFEQDPRLREIHLGWADGLEREEVFNRVPALRKARYESLLDGALTEGGESILELAVRIRAFRDEITERHRGRKVVVVGHNTPNRILLGDALGLPLEGIFSFRQDFGCLNVVEYGETRARVALLNGDPGTARD